MLQPAEIVTVGNGAPALDHAHLREVARYWLGLRGARALPARRDLDPLALSAPILPRLWIVDCEAGGTCFRFRLAGEEINATFGFPVRGLTLADAFPDRLRASVQARFERIAREACGCHCVGTVYVENERNGHGERLILPLSEDGRSVTQLLGVTHYAPGRGLDPKVARGKVLETFFRPEALAKACGLAGTAEGADAGTAPAVPSGQPGATRAEA